MTDLNELGETVFDPAIELQQVFIDPAKDVEQPPVFLEVGGNTTMTAGNFSTLIGKAKSKKSFFLMGIESALSSGKWGDVQGYCEGKKILHFDTEMSEFHASLWRKRLWRMNSTTDNVLAYGLRPYAPQERLQIIEYAILNTPDVCVVSVDGLRDLLSRGINDEAEATEITSKFLKWTADRQIHMIFVLHQNKNDLHARGHIGTEIMNKSETVISVSKADNSELSEVKAEYTRNMEFTPFTFGIDDTGLPEFYGEVIRTRPKSKPSEFTREQHEAILTKVFSKTASHTYGELWKSIKLAFETKSVALGVNKAKEFVTYYRQNGFIQQVDKFYELV